MSIIHIMGGGFFLRLCSNLKNLPKKRAKFIYKWNVRISLKKYIFQCGWRNYFLSSLSHSFNIENSAPRRIGQHPYTFEYFEIVPEENGSSSIKWF
jgi:hypothetical protein